MVVVLGAGGEDEDEVTCTLYYRTTANETVRDKYGALMFKVSSIGKLVSAGVGPAFDHRKPERSLTDDDRGGWREALYKFKQAERGDGAHYVSTEDVIFLLRCSTQIKDENTRWATVAAFAGAVSEVARGALDEEELEEVTAPAAKPQRMEEMQIAGSPSHATPKLKRAHEGDEEGGGGSAASRDVLGDRLKCT